MTYGFCPEDWPTGRGSVDLQEAPKNLANAIDEVEGLEAEHKEVKARQSAEWKKLRAKIASSAR